MMFMILLYMALMNDTAFAVPLDLAQVGELSQCNCNFVALKTRFLVHAAGCPGDSQVPSRYLRSLLRAS
jgi:hypothetical protein